MHCENVSNAAVKNTNIAEHVNDNIVVEQVLQEGSVKRHNVSDAVISISSKGVLPFLNARY